MYLHAHTLRFSLDGKDFAYACPPKSGVMFLEDATRSALEALGPLDALAWPKGAGNPSKM
jgi:tRNA pseudouridine32 synthase/23S rRNA pseudouridine746 synthase